MSELTRRARAKAWLNEIAKIKRKAIIYTGVVLSALVAGFFVQTVQLSNNQVASVKAQQEQACEARVETRKTLRDVLFHVVDLSDVLPGNEGAEAYTENRIAYIDATYPEITKEDCS